ncbi:MAG: Permease of the drug/metabolite transporter (DMT) superfamily [uncultured Rubrobacteraceae bacterium]|uniref:Permease of the drug/metabolite transporter (DMT) superfamily n=1 Tax=uncultured Rubrobacteraceae bacterium TaxID=349277 RepID=A0A6J4PTY0_9ACTN|nr:MAG: Permease of the drug/metabolite transporter (DMT) superfamily [uncultured Rubrobacteraceae bacterium]
MKPKDLVALILLGAIWGSSFLFIRVAVPAFGPLLLVELRVGLAALALAPFAVALGRVPEVRSHWRQFFVVGMLNAAIPFSLIAFAEIEITASLAAILNSTTVLFSALVAAVWTGDPLTGRKIFGVALGILGVAVLVGLDPLPLNGPVLLAVGASLAASLFYAISGTYIKKTFLGIRPLTLAVGQQTGGALWLLLPAAATLPGEAPPLPATLSAFGLAILCTAVAYLLYFTLIANVGPTSTLTVTFLAPGFGVLFGVLLLGEPFDLGTLAGLAIILLSVALVTGIGLDKVKERRDDGDEMG